MTTRARARRCRRTCARHRPVHPAHRCWVRAGAAAGGNFPAAGLPAVRRPARSSTSARRALPQQGVRRKSSKNPWHRNSVRRLNLTPTSTALGCVQCPLDSNVIDTNYDGTTAGKIRSAHQTGLFRLLAAFFASACLDLAALNSQALNSQALAATTERVVVNRYSGLAIEGFDPVAYFTDPGYPGGAGFRGRGGRRGLAFPQRG